MLKQMQNRYFEGIWRNALNLRVMGKQRHSAWKQNEHSTQLKFLEEQEKLNPPDTTTYCQDQNKQEGLLEEKVPEETKGRINSWR